MRYLPRPIGQRLRTWTAEVVNSLTRPLMAPTALDTLIDLPEKMAGMEAPPMPVPSSAGAFTAPREPMVREGHQWRTDHGPCPRSRSPRPYR